MSSDLQALLAAIVANPSDDVTRLVYADCLEEHGNTPRAQFIRLQIEVERHHPHSNTRATLESQARTLFEQHWREWWGEVCTAVGIEPATSAKYRLAESRTAVLEIFPGIPSSEPDESWEDNEEEHQLEQFDVTFRRGFPELVTFSPTAVNRPAIQSALPQWKRASPLAEVVARDNPAAPSTGSTWWPHGEHLRTVSALTFEYYNADEMGGIIGSPHVSNVERLTLIPGYPHLQDMNAVLESSCASRLKHLSMPMRGAGAAGAIASNETLNQLESLAVSVGYDPDFVQVMSALAGSSKLAGLQRLEVYAPASQAVVEAICRDPSWTRLRSLDLRVWGRETPLHTLASADVLPSLDELWLEGLQFTNEMAREMVQSPVLKRLRHFAILGGTYNDGHVFLPLVDAVDPARIETFAIGVPYFPERAANALRAKFGDRVRFLPT